MVRRWWAAALMFLACAHHEPAAPPATERSAPARPAGAPPAIELDPRAVDPQELPVIAVAATGEPTVELYAQDVQLDWLALHLADAPVVSRASDTGITGRLSAPSRKAAFQALIDASPAHGLSLRAPDLAGTGRRVDLALSRMPAQEMSLFLAELLGDDILTTVEDVPVTILVREAPADGVLRALAAAIGAGLRREEGIWILEPRGAAIPSRRRRKATPRVELRLDTANAWAVADLLRSVVNLGDPRCPIARAISARLRRAPVDIVAAALLDGADWVGPRCGTPAWSGWEPPTNTRLAGVAHFARRSAALLWSGGTWMVVKPDPDLADIVIGETSIGIRRGRDWMWESALAAPALPAELPGSRDFVGEWRLAATLRDGSVWRALLVGDAGAVWLSSAEKDRVLSIEPGKVVLPPDQPDGPAVVLRLRRAN